MTRIFVSFRRTDSSGYAGRIYDRLYAHFGSNAIFMDVTSIPAGVDFLSVLQDAVSTADAMIVLIGREWISVRDSQGGRRIDNPDDFVRIEVASALERNIRVIPVLIDGAQMPSRSELPDALQSLAYRNALELGPRSFNEDMVRLISVLETSAIETKAQKRTAPEWRIDLSKFVTRIYDRWKSVFSTRQSLRKAQEDVVERDFSAIWKNTDFVEHLILYSLSNSITGLSADQCFRVASEITSFIDRSDIDRAITSLKNGHLIAESKGERISFVNNNFRDYIENNVKDEEFNHLVDLSIQNHPITKSTIEFMQKAGFSTEFVDRYGVICQSSDVIWKSTSDIYLRLAIGRSLDLTEFQRLCEYASKAFASSLQDKTILVVIDQAPKISDLHQIFALKAEKSLVIVPIAINVIQQASLTEREAIVLKEQLDTYIGKVDLYDVRTDVSDVLSYFGRHSLLSTLDRNLTSGASTIMYGMRKIGKSSTLNRLREMSDWPIANVDMQAYLDSLDYLFYDALAGWKAVIENKYPHIVLPQTLSKIFESTAVLIKDDFRELFFLLLRELRKQPGEPGLLLFIDEMDLLIDHPDYVNFASFLRGLAEHNFAKGRFSILLAGLDPTLNRIDILDNSKRNPWFQFFVEQPIGALSMEDSKTMVLSIGGQMGISYSKSALNDIVTRCGGHPFITRQICSIASRQKKPPVQIGIKDSEIAFEGFLKHPDNYLYESLWVPASSSEEEMDILKKIAGLGQLTDDELLSTFRKQKKQNYKKAIRHLTDHYILYETEDQKLDITFPIYKIWIQDNILG